VSPALVLALFALDAEALVEATTRYVEQYRREFRQYVSDEREVQMFYDRSGNVRQKREILAECYVLGQPGQPDRTYEFRNILQVNGRKRLRDENLVPALLARRGAKFEEELLRLREESSRYNLFSGRGFLSNVALALLEMAGVPGRRDAQYRLSGRAGEDYLLEFTQPNRAALRTSGGTQPLTVQGRLQVTANGTLHGMEATLEVQNEQGSTHVRYALEYGPGPDGLQAPVKRVISVRLPGWDEPMAESVTTFSGYRRVNGATTQAER
jgi:hypothetical protein